MRTIALAFLVAFAPGCKLFRHPGKLVVREDPSRALVAHEVDGKKVETIFSDKSRDAIPAENGERLVILESSPPRFKRIEKGHTTDVWCPSPPADAVVLGVDVSGDHVLLRTEDSARKIEVVHFYDLLRCSETTLEVRYAYRGDVAPDGSQALIGAFPTTCTDTLDKCPITLWRLRPAGSPVPTEVVRGGRRASYQPRYFPGGKIVFQTTELDTTCIDSINTCRHDIVSMPIDGGPTSPLETIRTGAIAVALSRDEKTIAYLDYTSSDADCHARLPCKKMTLRLGDWRSKDATKDVAINKGDTSNLLAHPFSYDNRWIAFSAGEDQRPSVCHVDGTHCTSFDGHIVGWIK